MRWSDEWRGRPVVYRCFSVEGELLYIGYSLNLPQRLRLHRNEPRKSPWFPLMFRIQVELAPDRAGARAIEEAAIQAERPRFNRLGLVPAGDWIDLRERQIEECEATVARLGGPVRAWRL